MDAFQAARGEKLDITFKNVKLAFFQPAEKEILVLIHFHLQHPIMMGKKKTKDVQFYVEVMEASYSLDNTRRSGYDPDELEEEQRERAMRSRMNMEFQNFVKKVGLIPAPYCLPIPRLGSRPIESSFVLSRQSFYFTDRGPGAGY